MIRLTNILLVVIIISSCSKEKENSELHDFILKVSGAQILDKSRLVFIIPNAGCSGCILNSEHFMFDNIDKLDSSFFILTSFQSVKELRAKYSSIDPNILKHKKIILDKNNDFANVPIDKKYPIVVFVLNGVINDVQALDVDNQELLEKIRSN